MENIKLYESMHIPGYAEHARIWITEDDFFRVLKSEYPTFFFRTWKAYDMNDNLILSMIGDERMPAEIVERSLTLILNKNKPEPKVKEESCVIKNNKIMTTDEYSQEYKRMRQLSGLKRGQFNPNL
jgi:hypothetical protein